MYTYFYVQRFSQDDTHTKKLHKNFATEDVDLPELSSLMLWNTLSFMASIQFDSALLWVVAMIPPPFFSVLLKFQQQFKSQDLSLCKPYTSGIQYIQLRLNLWRLSCAKVNFHWAWTTASQPTGSAKTEQFFEKDMKKWSRYTDLKAFSLKHRNDK